MNHKPKKSLLNSMQNFNFIKWVKQYYKLVLFIFLGIFVPNYFTKNPLHYSGNNPDSFLIFVTLAFIIFLVNLFKEEDNSKLLETQRFFWPFLIPASLFLGIFIFLQGVISSLNNSIISLNFLVIWILYVGFLAILIFGSKLISDNIYQLLSFLLILLVYFVLTTLVWNNWLFLSKLITPIIYHILLPFTEQASYSIPDLPKHLIPMPTLSANDFSVKIGLPCSGIESLTFFISLYLLLIVHHFKDLKKFNVFVMFLLGLLGTFLLNILRLTLLMLIGIKYPEFALTHFHFNAGWIMFSIFILGFYYFTRDFIIKKKSSK